MSHRRILYSLGVVMAACSTTPPPVAPLTADAPDEAYEWLEDVHSERALAWVRAHNEKTVARLKGHPLYAAAEAEARAIFLAQDRIPYPSLIGEDLYNFWQDDKHVRGLWRRASLPDYSKKDVAWENVLDIDALAEREKENWVWKGANCVAPSYDRCLVWLSRGGLDASILREFDLKTKDWVPGGFSLPEAKSRVSWIDRDALFVGTDFGKGSLTKSGYPRLVKMWKRGTPLDSAVTIYEGTDDDMSVEAYAFASIPDPAGGGPLKLVGRRPSFFEEEIWFWRAGPTPTGTLTPVRTPRDAALQDAFDERLLFLLRSRWQPGALVFTEGSLVAVPVEPTAGGGLRAAIEKTELVFSPGTRGAIQNVSAGKSRLYLQTIEDVKGRLLSAHRSKDGAWSTKVIAYPDNGTVTLVSSHNFTDKAIVDADSLLDPSGLYLSEGEARPVPLKRVPARFDSKPFEARQEFAVSTDGERIPYFIVAPKKKAKGPLPTLMTGYGGFEISRDPHYIPVTGKTWLERGGVFVQANIRGGGEYGPRWHKAALKENRQKAFDDFAAIARDLIKKGVTTSEHLAILGGSNGGLLMGASFTQHPELFKGVLCQVPLLDMLRFHKLLAGHSWTGEYGNPDVPAERAALAAYSPFHRLDKTKSYPEVFFLTSTADDRVHPGHARKMAARMEAMGKPILYFEKIEGGHSAAANLEQRIERTALEFAYLFDKLMPETSAPLPAATPKTGSR